MNGIPTHWVWMAGFLVALISIGIIVKLVVNLKALFGKHEPCADGERCIDSPKLDLVAGHFQEAHDSLGCLKRMESSFLLMSREATIQTTLLKQIAKNGGKES